MTEDRPTCGWTLQLIPKGRKTPIEVICTEDPGHTVLHGDGEYQWSQHAQQYTTEPDTTIELP